MFVLPQRGVTRIRISLRVFRPDCVSELLKEVLATGNSERRLRLSAVVSSSICRTTTTSQRHTYTVTHTQLKPVAPFLSFSLRLSYSSVAIGYLAVLLLMSITSSLFILCGKQQDQNWDPKSLPCWLLCLRKEEERKMGFLEMFGLMMFVFSTGRWPYSLLAEHMLLFVACLFITNHCHHPASP